MSIRFGCDNCGQHLEAEAVMIGQSQDCPQCGRKVVVPGRSTIASSSETSEDIEFDCNQCGQHLVVDASAAGTLVPCPKCRASLTVPRLAVKNPHTWSASELIPVKPAPPPPLETSSPATPPIVSGRVAPNRYTALRMIALVCKILAGLSFLVGVVSVVTFFTMSDQRGGLEAAAGLGASAFLLTIWPLTFWAIAECIRVLLDIEANTRASRAYLEQLVNEP